MGWRHGIPVSTNRQPNLPDVCQAICLPQHDTHQRHVAKPHHESISTFSRRAAVAGHDAGEHGGQRWRESAPELVLPAPCRAGHPAIHEWSTHRRGGRAVQTLSAK